MRRLLMLLLLLPFAARAAEVPAPISLENALEALRSGNVCDAIKSEAGCASVAPVRGKEIAAQPVRRYVAGNWRITRSTDQAHAAAVSQEGDTLGGLAAQAGLDPAQWRSWLTIYTTHIVLANGAPVVASVLTEDMPLRGGQLFGIPNAIMAIWLGELGAVGEFVVDWERDLQYLSYRGFQVARMDDRRGADSFVALYGRLGAAKVLYGLFATAHGNTSEFCAPSGFDVQYANLRAGYGLGFVLVNACDGASARVLLSPYGVGDGVEGLMIPPFEIIHPSDILPPGRGGTRPAPRRRRPPRRLS